MQIIFTITIQKSELVANFMNPEKGEFLVLYIYIYILKSIDLYHNILLAALHLITYLEIE